MNITVSEKNDTEVEISGEIPAEDFKKERETVLKSLSLSLPVDGFRKGHVPEHVVVSKVGEDKILHEMAERALAAAYPKIISENKIDAIGRPEIAITKMALGSPLGFRIKQAVMPKIELPDYKKIVSEVIPPLGGFTSKLEVTDKEIDAVITNLRNSRKKSPKDETEIAPILDDAFAQSIGNFKSVAELKDKIRENLTHEKEARAKGKRRQEIIDSILEKTPLNCL